MNQLLLVCIVEASLAHCVPALEPLEQSTDLSHHLEGFHVRHGDIESGRRLICSTSAASHCTTTETKVGLLS